MLIYEVHLATARSIHDPFLSWLEKHMQEILDLPGFTQATWYQPAAGFEDNFVQVKLTEEAWSIYYSVASEAHLKEYLSVHAPRLRADGPGRFGNDLRMIGRRVLRTGTTLVNQTSTEP